MTALPPQRQLETSTDGYIRAAKRNSCLVFTIVGIWIAQFRDSIFGYPHLFLLLLVILSFVTVCNILQLLTLAKCHDAVNTSTIMKDGVVHAWHGGRLIHERRHRQGKYFCAIFEILIPSSYLRYIQPRSSIALPLAGLFCEGNLFLCRSDQL